jgi:uncharacterized protein (DUF302 family)
MLPCNVIVQEKADGKVQVSAINPMTSMQSVSNPNLSEVAETVTNKLLKVLNNI